MRSPLTTTTSVSAFWSALASPATGRRGGTATRSPSANGSTSTFGKAAKGTWRLDFAKDELSVEVAFNHRSDISWNLIKPTLASELNHVQKAIQTSGGIIITATEDMKAAGGFDNACGTYEDYVQYLKPMSSILPALLAMHGLASANPDSITVGTSKRVRKELPDYVRIVPIPSEARITAYDGIPSMPDNPTEAAIACYLKESFVRAQLCGLLQILGAEIFDKIMHNA